MMKVKYKQGFVGVLGFVVLVLAVLLSSFLSSLQAGAVECTILPDAICDNNGKSDINGDSVVDAKDSAVWQILLLVVNIMTAGAALVATGGIIYGAVLYTSAGPNQEQLKKAKDIIRNVVIGVLVFALMYSLLQWLIPGGVF